MKKLNNRFWSIFPISPRKKVKMKEKGFTILELLVASTMSAIIFSSALAMVTSVYSAQVRIDISQQFYGEGRILIERLSQYIRNNTLDYDHYFSSNQHGPSSLCTVFKDSQVDNEAKDSSNNSIGSGDKTNTSENRTTLGYPNIFYWDTDNDGTQDRQLGGKKTDGTTDECAHAFEITTNGHNNLLLINGSQNMRLMIQSTNQDYSGTLGFDKNNDGFVSQSSITSGDDMAPYQIVIRRELGIDTDNDGIANGWGLANWNDGNNRCEITNQPVLGAADSKDWCLKSHDWVAINHPSIKILQAKFFPAPTQDPYLAFRIDEAQVHPHVVIQLEVELENATKHGFKKTTKPYTVLQTAVSSRVYGDPR